MSDVDHDAISKILGSKMSPAPRLSGPAASSALVQVYTAHKQEVKKEEEKKPTHCSICGRFLSKDGRCMKVFYDDYSGAWDHS